MNDYRKYCIPSIALYSYMEIMFCTIRNAFWWVYDILSDAIAGCFLLVVSIWCRRRWRNYVSFWGEMGKYVDFSCFSFFIISIIYVGSRVVTLTFWCVQHDLNIGTGYDYKKCIGLKVKPQRGDGLLFYSVFPNGTIDRVTVFFIWSEC